MGEEKVADMAAGLAMGSNLVNVLLENIGKIAPGNYEGNLYADLNEFGMLCDRLRREGIIA